MLEYILIGCGILAGVLLVFALFWLCNNALVTTRYTLEIQGLERQVKIVQLSDLHGKSFGKNNIKLIERVRALNPDIIAVTGDIIHKYTAKNKRTALALVADLCAIAPVVFCSGNHEMRNKGYCFFRKDLMEAGALVLDDCPADMCGLTVVGLKCSSLKNGKAQTVAQGCTGIKVLLAHMPQFFENYVSAGYDVVLSGHAHGGQWRIPFTHKGLYAPGQGLFPKYSEGLHSSGKTRMIISRGLGNSQFPLRLFNRPEIVEITLSPQH